MKLGCKVEPFSQIIDSKGEPIENAKWHVSMFTDTDVMVYSQIMTRQEVGVMLDKSLETVETLKKILLKMRIELERAKNKIGTADKAGTTCQTKSN